LQTRWNLDERESYPAADCHRYNDQPYAPMSALWPDTLVGLLSYRSS
jgi:hypothetical protein